MAAHRLYHTTQYPNQLPDPDLIPYIPERFKTATAIDSDALMRNGLNATNAFIKANAKEDYYRIGSTSRIEADSSAGRNLTRDSPPLQPAPALI